MAFDIACTEVAPVAHNAGYAGLPQFAISFHGGSEPTMGRPIGDYFSG
jgi:hypothetical protein